MRKNARILVTDYENAIGRAIISLLERQNYSQLKKIPSGVDLQDRQSIEIFFVREKPEYVFLTTMISGGIGFNIRYPADLMDKNLTIIGNILQSARKVKTKKVLFFGASCMYPREYVHPVNENDLLDGPLEETSRPYAIAKIAGVELGRAFATQYGLKSVVIIPATIYGPGGKFNKDSDHVLGALLSRFHEAKLKGSGSVVIWGSGSPRREFIYTDDLAEACLLAMKASSDLAIYNVGTGEEITIKDLAHRIKRLVSFHGKVKFDYSKPDGAKRKLLDSTKIRKLGWKPRFTLEKGLENTYKWYQRLTKT